MQPFQQTFNYYRERTGFSNLRDDFRPPSTSAQKLTVVRDILLREFLVTFM